MLHALGDGDPPQQFLDLPLRVLVLPIANLCARLTGDDILCGRGRSAGRLHVRSL